MLSTSGKEEKERRREGKERGSESLEEESGVDEEKKKKKRDVEVTKGAGRNRRADIERTQKSMMKRRDGDGGRKCGRSGGNGRRKGKDEGLTL